MTDQGPDFGLRTDFYTFAPQALARELPDFEIGREVGKGSMGIVYEAWRRKDGQRVALKVLPPSLTLTERALARFLREGELLLKVRHPAIVAALEHGRQGRLHYFVMEFVDGVTAEERVRLGPLPVRQAIELAIQVARALQFAHEHGVVHRDVKPGNLMIRDDGRVAITDFGLARETGTGSMTESGTIIGTPIYMAPEQVLGDHRQIGTRTDIYGLGATLYQLLTGVAPFSASTTQGVLKAALEREPVRPRRLRADVPSALEAIVRVAMSKDATRRYGSAEEMAEDLERCLRGERVWAKPEGMLTRGLRNAVKRPLWATLAAAVVVLAVGGWSWLRAQHFEELSVRLRSAEGKIAQTSSLRDDQLRVLSPNARQGLLHAAVEIATEVIAKDPTYAMAWLVRAQANHRLQQYSEALADLDQAERCRGSASPEILHFRIDALRHLPASTERLWQDLNTLLHIDPGSYTHCLTAEHLLDLAETASVQDRVRFLDAADRVLTQITEHDPRVELARVRVQELRGDHQGALAALEDVRKRFSDNPLLHYHAARLLRRLGRDRESDHEQELARALDPLAWSQDPSESPMALSVDPRATQTFLQHLNALLENASDG